MRRGYIGILIFIITLIIVATILNLPQQSSPLQRISAVFLGLLGGVAALAEVVGLIDRLRPSTTSHSSDRDWATATERAVKRFKKQQTQYRWVSGHENIRVEGLQVEKGRGILTIAVTTEETLRGMFDGELFGPKLLAKYELTIDRTGDILEIKSIQWESMLVPSKVSPKCYRKQMSLSRMLRNQ